MTSRNLIDKRNIKSSDCSRNLKAPTKYRRHTNLVRRCPPGSFSWGSLATRGEYLSFLDCRGFTRITRICFPGFSGHSFERCTPYRPNGEGLEMLHSGNYD